MLLLRLYGAAVHFRVATFELPCGGLPVLRRRRLDDGEPAHRCLTFRLTYHRLKTGFLLHPLVEGAFADTGVMQRQIVRCANTQRLDDLLYCLRRVLRLTSTDATAVGWAMCSGSDGRICTCILAWYQRPLSW